MKPTPHKSSDIADLDLQADLIARFYKAMEAGSVQMLQSALDDGLDPNTFLEFNSSGRRIAQLSVNHKRHLIEALILFKFDERLNDLLITLIKSGSDPRKVVTPDGETALMRAIDGLRMNMAKTLIEGGDDVNAVRKDGASVLHKACMAMPGQAAGQTYFLDLLEKHGLSFDVRPDFLGRTPLHHLAQNPDGARWILQRKPEWINVQDASGMTVLTRAILGRSDRCIEALLGYGADIHMRDKVGLNALEMARYQLEHGEFVTPESRHRAQSIVDKLELFAKANQARDLISGIRAQASSGTQP